MLKTRIFIIPLIAIIAILVGVGIKFSRNKTPKYDFVLAKRANIVQEVSVTGKIKPAQDVDLAFEKGGKIATANVKVGDRVTVGQALVTLDNADLAAQLAQAEANIRVQQAKLAELKSGTRPEEILVQEVKVTNAEVAFSETKQNVVDKLKDAYTKSDDGVRNKVDQIFTDPRSVNPKVKFLVYDFDIERELVAERLAIENVLKLWQSMLGQLTLVSDLQPYLDTAQKNLNQVRTLLDKAASAIAYAAPTQTITQAIIDSWRVDVSTARTNLNTAVTNLSAAEEDLRTAQSNLVLAEQELILKKAGPTIDQINAQEAMVQEVEANAQNIRAQLSKTNIVSPINGIVTKQEAKVGEIFAASVPVVSIISASKFQIEANIPEADIAKVKISDEAHVTLDAYANDVIFDAFVIAVDPAETIVEGVATYKTTLVFINEDARIKSGMTANIDVVTAERENVIVVPQRVVKAKNSHRYVEILVGQNLEEREVKTGVRGVEGDIEITEGLQGGEQVIVSKGK